MGLFSQAAFYTTVNHLHDLPQHSGREVAFVGRSNAGKSSAINTLANYTRLAYVSKTPGRTQHLNYFSLGNGNFLVDLPGYGYAKVPPDVQKHWEDLLGQYLQTREALCGLVIAGLVGTGHDVTLFKWTVPFVVSLFALAVIVAVMVRVPLANAGRPEEPAPPTAIM